MDLAPYGCPKTVFDGMTVNDCLEKQNPCQEAGRQNMEEYMENQEEERKMSELEEENERLRKENELLKEYRASLPLKERLYDRIPLNVKQMDRIIVILLAILAGVVILGLIDR